MSATVTDEARVLPAGATVASVLELLDVAPNARRITIVVIGCLAVAAPVRAGVAR